MSGRKRRRKSGRGSEPRGGFGVERPRGSEEREFFAPPKTAVLAENADSEKKEGADGGERQRRSSKGGGMVE